MVNGINQVDAIPDQINAMTAGTGDHAAITKRSWMVVEWREIGVGSAAQSKRAKRSHVPPTTAITVNTTCAVRSVIVNQTSAVCMASANRNMHQAVAESLAGERPKRIKWTSVIAALMAHTAVAAKVTCGEVATSMMTASEVKNVVQMPQTTKPKYAARVSGVRCMPSEKRP